MFISAVLRFLQITEKELRFDPTIYKHNGSNYIQIMLDAQPEQYYLDAVISQKRYLAGRAITYQRAYCDNNKSSSPFTVKDSQEYKERPKEGLLLKKLTEAGV